MTVVLNVPTINDDLSDFDKLFDLWNQANDDFLDVAFDFSRCRFLRHNAVAFLGGLTRLIQSRYGTVIFNWNTLRSDIRSNLEQNGFISN